MHQGGDCSVVFYVRIGGALMAPFFFGGRCIRDLVLCDCVTVGGCEGLALTRMLELWH